MKNFEICLSRQGLCRFSALIFALIFVVFFAMGCTESEKSDPFGIFKKDFTSEIELSYNGVFALCKVTKKSDCLRTEFLSPETTKNLVFLTENGNDFVEICGEKYEIPKELAKVQNIILNIVNAEKKEITSVTGNVVGDKTLTKIEADSLVFLFYKDGLPKKVQGKAENKEFTLTFKNFEVAK